MSCPTSPPLINSCIPSDKDEITLLQSQRSDPALSVAHCNNYMRNAQPSYFVKVKPLQVIVVTSRGGVVTSRVGVMTSRVILSGVAGSKCCIHPYRPPPEIDSVSPYQRLVT